MLESVLPEMSPIISVSLCRHAVLHSPVSFCMLLALLVAGVAAGIVIGGLTSEILKRVRF